MSEPTCRALCCRSEGCLSGVRTYLPGTVLQGGGQFKGCRNLPTSHELWGRGAGCLNGVATYLPALCCKGAGCLSGVGTYLPGTVLQGCRMFKRCRNLPEGHCVSGLQDV